MESRQQQQMISQSLGVWLRQAREAQGRSLAEAEEATRIRRKFLAALENGQWSQLPSEIVGRGFLRNYARFLGLDTEEALARLRGESPAPVPQPQQPESAAEATAPLPSEPAEREEAETPTPPAPSGPKPEPDARQLPETSATADYTLLEQPLFEPRRVPWLRIVGIVLLVLLLAAVGFASWAYWNNPQLLTRIGIPLPVATPLPTDEAVVRVTRITATPTSSSAAQQSPLVTPSPSRTLAPTATDTPQASATPTDTATLRPTRTTTPTSTLTATVPPIPAEGLELFVHTLDRCWLDVYTDGENAYVGLLEVDEVRSFPAEREIRLTIGDGGVLEVTINGQRLGLLGEREEIVWVSWTLEEDRINQSRFTPTPILSASSTPTAGPTEAETAEPTATTAPTAESSPTPSQ